MWALWISPIARVRGCMCRSLHVSHSPPLFKASLPQRALCFCLVFIRSYVWSLLYASVCACKPILVCMIRHYPPNHLPPLFKASLLLRALCCCLVFIRSYVCSLLYAGVCACKPVWVPSFSQSLATIVQSAFVCLFSWCAVYASACECQPVWLCMIRYQSPNHCRHCAAKAIALLDHYWPHLIGWEWLYVLVFGFYFDLCVEPLHAHVFFCRTPYIRHACCHYYYDIVY